MSNDQLESRMAFIVEQQAQFASDIQQLRESQAQTDSVVARLANVTLEGFKDVNTKINALVDAQIRTEANLSRTERVSIPHRRESAKLDDRYRPPL